MAEKMVIEDSCGLECRERQFCAAVSRMSEEDPIGSAAAFDRYLLVEVPAPWASPITDSKHFPAGLKDELKKAAAEGRKFRFFAFASDDHSSPEGFRRVLYFEKPSVCFARLTKIEYVIPVGQVHALAANLLHSPERNAAFEAYKLDNPNVRDLFVCSHGSHDVCCGKLGYPIYRVLEENYAAKSSGKLRVWRASHFGGHRYAPTIADMPEGRYWAHIEPADLDCLVNRNGSFSKLSRKYRGWGGFGAYEQILEREIMIREGWDWVNYNKSGTVIEKDERSARVAIEYSSSDGAISGVYEGTVAASYSVRIGGCGTEDRDVPQYEVITIRKLRG